MMRASLRESVVITAARAAALAARRAGFARGVRVVDWDALVEATEPPEGLEADLCADIGVEVLSPSDRALWLGTWRAVLRGDR